MDGKTAQLREFLVVGLGLSDDEIDDICEGKDLKDTYDEGLFCSQCPSLRNCLFPPAQKERDRQGIELEIKGPELRLDSFLRMVSLVALIDLFIDDDDEFPAF